LKDKKIPEGYAERAIIIKIKTIIGVYLNKNKINSDFCILKAIYYQNFKLYFSQVLILIFISYNFSIRI